MGFLLMGFIGYFIKLIHIPINNIIVYDCQCWPARPCAPLTRGATILCSGALPKFGIEWYLEWRGRAGTRARVA